MNVLVNGKNKNLVAIDESGKECTRELLYDYGYAIDGVVADSEYNKMINVCEKYNTIIKLTNKLAKCNYDALMQYYKTAIGCDYGECGCCGLECELERRIQWLREHLHSSNDSDNVKFNSIII